MMKVLRSILLLLLTFAVLVSSTGMTLGMHLCAGEVNNFTLSGHSEPCPMEQKKETPPPCHSKGGQTAPMETPADDCCEDQTVHIQKVELLGSSGKTISAKLEFSFVALAVMARLFLFDLFSSKPAPFAEYSPPALTRNIPVLLQSFLI
jgi:hypothetical protein